MSKMDQIHALAVRKWQRKTSRVKAPVHRTVDSSEREALRQAIVATPPHRAKISQGRTGRPKGPITVPLPVRIPPALLAKIDAEASKRGMPRNGLVTTILAEAMEKS